MVNYPCLSAKQRQTLPELLHATPLPIKFEDSTHRLWRCDTVDGEMILKVCNHTKVRTSSFWQGMKHLFAVDLPSSLGDFAKIYTKVTQTGSLSVPDYIASGSASDDGHSPAFILTRFVSGSMVETSDIDEVKLKILAGHLSQMHQCKQNTWGSILASNMTAMQWPQRLQHTLRTLAGKQTSVIPSDMLEHAVKLAGTISPQQFVPIMPDLRWDQFLHHDGKLSALVDLDAFVFGPRELEWVLLEYLLDEQQANIFAEHYQKTLALPDLSLVRIPYRLLLFLMNVLGEKNVDAWMQAPTRF